MDDDIVDLSDPHWTCPHCTFINNSAPTQVEFVCEVCGNARDGPLAHGIALPPAPVSPLAAFDADVPVADPMEAARAGAQRQLVGQGERLVQGLEHECTLAPSDETGPNGELWDVDISSDGRFLASAGGYSDASGRLYHLSTGELISVLRGHNESCDSVHFSPCSQYLVTTSFDQRLFLWATHDASLVGIFVGHTDKVFDAKFHPVNGHYIASSAADNEVRVWETETQACVASLRLHERLIFRLAWNDDGSMLATTSDDQTVGLWDTRVLVEKSRARKRRIGGDALVIQTSKAMAHELERQQRAEANGEELDPDSIPNLTEAEVAQLGSFTPLDPPIELKAHLEENNGDVGGASFSPDNRYLATSVWEGDHGVHVWDLEAKPPTMVTLGQHTRNVRGVAFAPTGKHIISIGDDRLICVWRWDPDNFEPGNNLLHFVQAHEKNITGLAISRSWNIMATSSHDKHLQLWKLPPILSLQNSLLVFLLAVFKSPESDAHASFAQNEIFEPQLCPLIFEYLRGPRPSKRAGLADIEDDDALE